MNIRAATLADIPEISELLTQLTQDFIAPTCTEEGAAILVNAMSIEAIGSYFAMGTCKNSMFSPRQSGRIYRELGIECTSCVLRFWL